MNVYTVSNDPGAKRVLYVKEIKGRPVLYQIYPGLPKAVKDIKR